MKNKSKYYRIPVCIFIFVVGSITAMLFASVLNDVLTTGSISTDLTDFSTTISGVFGGEKPRKLYLLLEALVVLLCVVYFVCAERSAPPTSCQLRWKPLIRISGRTFSELTRN